MTYSVKGVTSLPFINSLPWPHGIVKCPLNADPGGGSSLGHPGTFRLLFYEYCEFFWRTVFHMQYSREVFNFRHSTCFNEWFIDSFIHMICSKWLIHLETKQVTLFMNGSLNQMIRSKTDSFRNETPQCCSEMHKCSTLALFVTSFIGKTEKADTVLSIM